MPPHAAATVGPACCYPPAGSGGDCQIGDLRTQASSYTGTRGSVALSSWPPRPRLRHWRPRRGGLLARRARDAAIGRTTCGHRRRLHACRVSQPAGGFLRVDDRNADIRATVGTWRFTWASDGTAYSVPVPAEVVGCICLKPWHESEAIGGLLRSQGRPCELGWDHLLEQFKPLAGESPTQLLTPVRLCPGCARLTANPERTGSATDTNTIGIVDVALCPSMTAFVGRQISDRP